MNIFHGVIFGIVEGLTEFLPISSTFHLITFSRLLGLTPTPFVKMFEVVIQGGAILSLMFIYTRTLLSNKTLLLRVITSFVPTAIVGAILYKIIKEVFFSTNWLMLVAFVGVGVLFLLLERLISSGKLVPSRSLFSLTQKEAILIGLAQATAVIPGVSRSGAVLLLMILLGYRRDEAAKYTFLLSVPTILAATCLDLFRNRLIFTNQPGDLMVLILGFASAFLVAYFVVTWLLQYLATHTLRIFAWYRFIVAGLILLILGI